MKVTINNLIIQFRDSLRRKINILLFFALVLHIPLLNAQGPSLVWANAIGSPSSSCKGKSIAVDTNGNVYTTGSFSGNVDFDPGIGTALLHSFGNRDMYVCKFDATGSFLWARRFGDIDDDAGNSITIDLEGNVLVTGSLKFPQTQNDISVFKFSSNGNLVWQKNWGGIMDDYAFSIHTDNSGNTYLTGTFRDTVDFDPGPGILNLFSASGQDIFISKLDTLGNLIFAKSIGGSSNDAGTYIVSDSMQNIYVTGNFGFSVDFDPGPGSFSLSSNGIWDSFILKLNSSGNFVWAKKIGGGDLDLGVSLTVDGYANIYIAGYFKGSVDFDPGIATFYLNSGALWGDFVLKLDSSGYFIWAKGFADIGIVYDLEFSICSNNSGTIFLSGNFSGTVDFDPDTAIMNLTSTSGYDIFIAQMDPTGHSNWARKIGNTANDAGISIASGPPESVFTTGYFGGNVNFDLDSGTYNLTSSGIRDIFVLKFSQLGVSVYETNYESKTIISPNPTTGFLKINNPYCTDKNCLIEIFNTLGEKIYSAVYHEGLTLNCELFPPGIYFVRIGDSEKQLTQKLIVE